MINSVPLVEEDKLYVNGRVLNPGSVVWEDPYIPVMVSGTIIGKATNIRREGNILLADMDVNASGYDPVIYCTHIESHMTKNALVITYARLQSISLVPSADNPPRLMPGTERDIILLAGGGKVSKAAVEALDKLEETWPGATCPQARPAIVQAVTKALNK